MTENTEKTSFSWQEDVNLQFKNANADVRKLKLAALTLFSEINETLQSVIKTNKAKRAKKLHDVLAVFLYKFYLNVQLSFNEEDMTKPGINDIIAMFLAFMIDLRMITALKKPRLYEEIEKEIVPFVCSYLTHDKSYLWDVIGQTKCFRERKLDYGNLLQYLICVTPKIVNSSIEYIKFLYSIHLWKKACKKSVQEIRALVRSIQPPRKLYKWLCKQEVDGSPRLSKKFTVEDVIREFVDAQLPKSIWIGLLDNIYICNGYKLVNVEKKYKNKQPDELEKGSTDEIHEEHKKLLNTIGTLQSEGDILLDVSDDDDDLDVEIILVQPTVPDKQKLELPTTKKARNVRLDSSNLKYHLENVSDSNSSCKVSDNAVEILSERENSQSLSKISNRGKEALYDEDGSSRILKINHKAKGDRESIHEDVAMSTEKDNRDKHVVEEPGSSEEPVDVTISTKKDKHIVEDPGRTEEPLDVTLSTEKVLSEEVENSEEHGIDEPSFKEKVNDTVQGSRIQHPDQFQISNKPTFIETSKNSAENCNGAKSFSKVNVIEFSDHGNKNQNEELLDTDESCKNNIKTKDNSDKQVMEIDKDTCDEDQTLCYNVVSQNTQVEAQNSINTSPAKERSQFMLDWGESTPCQKNLKLSQGSLPSNSPIVPTPSKLVKFISNDENVINSTQCVVPNSPDVFSSTPMKPKLHLSHDNNVIDKDSSLNSKEAEMSFNLSDDTVENENAVSSTTNSPEIDASVNTSISFLENTLKKFVTKKRKNLLSSDNDDDLYESRLYLSSDKSTDSLEHNSENVTKKSNPTKKKATFNLELENLQLDGTNEKTKMTKELVSRQHKLSKIDYFSQSDSSQNNSADSELEGTIVKIIKDLQQDCNFQVSSLNIESTIAIQQLTQSNVEFVAQSWDEIPIPYLSSNIIQNKQNQISPSAYQNNPDYSHSDSFQSPSSGEESDIDVVGGGRKTLSPMKKEATPKKAQARPKNAQACPNNTEGSTKNIQVSPQNSKTVVNSCTDKTAIIQQTPKKVVNTNQMSPSAYENNQDDSHSESFYSPSSSEESKIDVVGSVSKTSSPEKFQGTGKKVRATHKKGQAVLDKTGNSPKISQASPKKDKTTPKKSTKSDSFSTNHCNHDNQIKTSSSCTNEITVHKEVSPTNKPKRVIMKRRHSFLDSDSSSNDCFQHKSDNKSFEDPFTNEVTVSEENPNMNKQSTKITKRCHSFLDSDSSGNDHTHEKPDDESLDDPFTNEVTVSEENPNMNKQSTKITKRCHSFLDSDSSGNDHTHEKPDDESLDDPFTNEVTVSEESPNLNKQSTPITKRRHSYLDSDSSSDDNSPQISSDESLKDPGTGDIEIPGEVSHNNTGTKLIKKRRHKYLGIYALSDDSIGSDDEDWEDILVPDTAETLKEVEIKTKSQTTEKLDSSVSSKEDNHRASKVELSSKAQIDKDPSPSANSDNEKQLNESPTNEKKLDKKSQYCISLSKNKSKNVTACKAINNNFSATQNNADKPELAGNDSSLTLQTKSSDDSILEKSMYGPGQKNRMLKRKPVILLRRLEDLQLLKTKNAASSNEDSDSSVSDTLEKSMSIATQTLIKSSDFNRLSPNIGGGKVYRVKAKKNNRKKTVNQSSGESSFEETPRKTRSQIRATTRYNLRQNLSTTQVYKP